jgi:hypothetical protein
MSISSNRLISAMSVMRLAASATNPLLSTRLGTSKFLELDGWFEAD